MRAPARYPGESLEAYEARLQVHIGIVLEEVVAEIRAAGGEPPGWILALKSLRDASMDFATVPPVPGEDETGRACG